jgi:hypothetical protein
LDVFKELITEPLEQDTLFKELVVQQKEATTAIGQMAEYLKEYQNVVDFALKDSNQKLLYELKSQFNKLSLLLNPDLVGVNRMDDVATVVSSENTPVDVLSKSYLIKMAENTIYYTTTTNRAYYTVGYLSSLTTSYAYYDEGYSNEPGTAQNIKIVSDSTSDTSNGTGAQKVTVGGLDSSHLRITEVITTNGTTAVTSVNQFTYIDRINVTQVGSNGFAVGNISATNTGGGTTYGKISAGENTWRAGKFFVPSNQAAYVDLWVVGGSTTAVRSQLLATSVSELPPGPLAIRAGAFTNTSSVVIPFPVPIRVPNSGLITIRGRTNNTTSEVNTAFDIHVRVE